MISRTLRTAKRNGTAFWAGGIAQLALLSGCMTLGPDYEAPEVIVADDWHQELVGSSSADNSQWWATLGDSKLEELIARAASGNLSLRAAIARIDESERLLGIAKGERAPDVNGSGAYQRSKSVAGVLPFVDTIDEFSDAGASGSWELDFWGRVRRTVESAQASYEASVESFRDVQVILNAEVAGNYVLLRTLQERLRLANSNVDRQQETLKLVEARHRAELAPDLELEQARSNLATTQSAVPALMAAIRQTINNLSTLLGEQPGPLTSELLDPGPLPRSGDVLQAGIPADAVRMRPDVRRAERALAAQTARIGIARTALYPNFSLSGNFGYSAVGGSLVDDDNENWAIGPVFFWNLFDGGRVRNQIAVEEARTEQALVAYEASVLEALRDTENSLVAYVYELERLGFLQRAVEAASTSADLVRKLYRSGLTDFQNVLDTERALFVQQDLYAISEGNVVQNLIATYRAMGGGWSAGAGAAQ
ncbi:MAG: efflux transporter outer membrane subunit [Pseudomonadales bacterium]